MEALGVKLGDLIFQIIAFLLLIFLLYRVGYKPLLKLLDDRATNVRESLEAAERARQEMAAAEQRGVEELQQARREAQEIISRAREQSEQTVAQARNAAREEAERVRASIEQQTAAEQQRAREELRQEVVDLAILAASRVVRQSLDTEQHRRLIEETLREATQNQGGQAAD